MSGPEERTTPEGRGAYRVWRAMSTRWRDNDVYAHLNNAVYFEYFDSVVNGWLLERGLLTLGGGETVGLVVENRCAYFAPIAFPDRIDAGMRAHRIGRSSVVYAIGLFRGDAPEPAAQGLFTHVMVDRAAHRPVPIPDDLRGALREISLEA